MGCHLKLLYQNHRLLRDAWRLKKLYANSKGNWNPSVLKIYSKQPGLGRDLQNDNPSVQDQWANCNYLFKFQMIDNPVANYHKLSNSPDQKMRN